MRVHEKRAEMVAVLDGPHWFVTDAYGVTLTFTDEEFRARYEPVVTWAAPVARVASAKKKRAK